MTIRRRIVTFDWLTVDGYFALSDGNLNWVVPDNEQANAAAAGMRHVDTIDWLCSPQDYRSHGGLSLIDGQNPNTEWGVHPTYVARSGRDSSQRDRAS
jgi:hypothetical protein